MKNFTLKFHCIFAFLLRIILVIYSKFHDENFNVSYTDVDYEVFTDAARYILDGLSPFERHTYRYSPLLALVLTPNITLSAQYGKILFSFIDILVALLIYKLVVINKSRDENVAIKCACLWLYNPLTIVISTRGNADCLAAFLVILTLYFLQSGYNILGGLIHGISIHYRLYPLALSMAMYFSLRIPNYTFVNMKQIKFTFCCVMSLTILTAVSYYFYGYEFIYESLIYHLIRKDTRHNFSIFFYPLYLSMGNSYLQFFRIFNNIIQLVLLTSISIFYSSKRNLSFALMVQVFLLVICNTVMTSQYFFWFLCLYPLCSQRLNCNLLQTFTLFGIWMFSQGIWLLMAYILEFQSINTFNYIWIASILFFLTNIKVLVNVIKVYEKD
ncbi:GPI mannosyltransferase 1 [Leptopilina boulardi]|uniref:GPI mannosyltransferase 1 n=1 Tax=Leptopilina boulardi TaxID=63433 RepID=UPI0021F65E5D|nr:GPI mannosyltransferase 1 [Leptopilina boulardi]